MVLYFLQHLVIAIGVLFAVEYKEQESVNSIIIKYIDHWYR